MIAVVTVDGLECLTMRDGTQKAQINGVKISLRSGFTDLRRCRQSRRAIGRCLARIGSFDHSPGEIWDLWCELARLDGLEFFGMDGSSGKSGDRVCGYVSALVEWFGKSGIVDVDVIIGVKVVDCRKTALVSRSIAPGLVK